MFTSGGILDCRRDTCMLRVLLHHHLHKCEKPDIQQWDLHSSLKDKVVSFIYILHFVTVKFVYH